MSKPPLSRSPAMARQDANSVAMQLAMDAATNDDPVHVANRFAPILTRYAAGVRQAALEEALATVAMSAWRHEGSDSYSQGMDKGARDQAAASYEAVKYLLAASQQGGAV